MMMIIYAYRWLEEEKYISFLIFIVIIHPFYF